MISNVLRYSIDVFDVLRCSQMFSDVLRFSNVLRMPSIAYFFMDILRCVYMFSEVQRCFQVITDDLGCSLDVLLVFSGFFHDVFGCSHNI